MGLAQDLKAVADPEHRPPVGSMAADRLHDRAEAGDGPRPQIVSIAESARQNHDVGAAQIDFPVPDEVGLATVALGGSHGIEVAVAAGKPDHCHPWHQSSSMLSR